MSISPDDQAPGFPPAFTEALRRLERALILVQERGSRLPVIVGGAAVEFYTGGQTQSEDIDYKVLKTTLLHKPLSSAGLSVKIVKADCLKAFILPTPNLNLGSSLSPALCSMDGAIGNASAWCG